MKNIKNWKHQIRINFRFENLESLNNFYFAYELIKKQLTGLEKARFSRNRCIQKLLELGIEKVVENNELLKTKIEENEKTILKPINKTIEKGVKEIKSVIQNELEKSMIFNASLTNNSKIEKPIPISNPRKEIKEDNWLEKQKLKEMLEQ